MMGVYQDHTPIDTSMCNNVVPLHIEIDEGFDFIDIDPWHSYTYPVVANALSQRG